ncbi:MAG TPA: hypothetical protein EYP33_05600 [Pyrodictium sp.]|nr:hypothetical protein [Pyrodictium sp.]
MRGYGSLFGGILLASMTVVALAVLAAAVSQGVAGVRNAAEHAAALSVPPRIMLEPLGSCNSSGWLSAQLSVEPVVKGFEPGLVEVFDVSSGELLYTRQFYRNNTVVVDIPCSGYVELVVVGRSGGAWLYRYELDPSKPCLEGPRVNGLELLYNATSCVAPGLDTASVAEATADAVIEKVLEISYGPLLQPVWATAPLLPGANPVSVAASGLLPGVNVDPERTLVTAITGLPVSNAQRSSSIELRPGQRKTMYVYERILEPLAGGLLLLRHREAAVWVSIPANSGYCWRLGNPYSYGPRLPGLSIDAAGFLHTGDVWRKRYSQGSCTGYWQHFTEYKVPGYIPLTGGVKVGYEAVGVAGSLTIPFLVTKDANPETIVVTLVPRLQEAKVHEYFIKDPYRCYSSLQIIRDSNYVGTARISYPPVYVSIKLHVFPANTYNPGKLIVSLTNNLDSAWLPLVQKPVYTVTVLRPVKLGSTIVKAITISPAMLKYLGSTAAAGVIVLEIVYAAGIGSWVPYLVDPVDVVTMDEHLGYVAPVGAEFLLYLGHSHKETARTSSIAVPFNMRVEPSSSAKLVATITVLNDTITFAGCNGALVVERTTTLQNPGMIVYEVIPGSQVEIRYSTRAQPALAKTASINYTGYNEAPFPLSIIQEVLRDGSKALIIT